MQINIFIVAQLHVWTFPIERVKVWSKVSSLV